MRQGYVKILYKLIFLLLPLLVMFVLYLMLDPFKVLYHYDNFFVSGEAPIVTLNKDYVTTEMFLNNYKKYNYDSYIFGSSRSMFYEVKDWEKYIHSDKCFHFDAWKESLYGIYLKIALLDQRHLPIKNALIVFDTSVLEETTDCYREANLYMKHPFLSGSNKLSFQYEFVKAFSDPRLFFAYTDYRIGGKIKPYMRNLSVFDENLIHYNDTTNEVNWFYIDSILAKDPEEYYKEHSKLFIKRDSSLSVSKAVIGVKQKMILGEIHDILVKNNTSYKIIISPHYYQRKLNNEDLNILKDLFGSDRVYDFSGKNWITEDKHNFYDMGHYRPEVARYILSVVYGGSK